MYVCMCVWCVCVCMYVCMYACVCVCLCEQKDFFRTTGHGSSPIMRKLSDKEMYHPDEIGTRGSYQTMQDSAADLKVCAYGVSISVCTLLY